MLRQALILSSNRQSAQAMREALLKVVDTNTRVDVELDAMRAMQLVPQQYELILIDVLLDSMDGLQLLMLMRQQSPASKFVIVGDESLPDRPNGETKMPGGTNEHRRNSRSPRRQNHFQAGRQHQ